MSDAADQALTNLIGQHPAALRSVSWQPVDDASLQHLELETKHGQVVVFDHRQPIVWANPPRPDDASTRRQWRDLTAQADAAFDNRPTISAVRLSTTATGAACWRVDLSTGRFVVFVPDPVTPLLWCE